MPVLTGARYAIRVLADSEGYVTSTEILDTPEAIGAINTDSYPQYGVYEWGGGAAEKTDGDIELSMDYPRTIGTSSTLFTVLLARADIASDGAVFVMFAPPETTVEELVFDDTQMSDGYVVLAGSYEADTEPTFFLGTGGIAPPPTSFWTSFVGSREII